MAGVKKFDRTEVLERAMRLFWQRGYEGTSVGDLVAATGINRGSLYGTFGSKRGLFLAALDHYALMIGKPLLPSPDDPDPRRAIEQMFNAIITRTSNPDWPRGCLMTNSALECPGIGDEIARKVGQGIGRQESAIYRVLLRAQANGLLDDAADARALARFFVGVAHGMNVVNKATADPTILRDMVTSAMSIWREPITQD
ncbi:MAG TPA: helix-turn-helix domain-containing protein [Candidatus Binataceae bacterium]|nr:helix-turn-helix domain-containing protein [Candidatus Binataceae bacterium]